MPTMSPIVVDIPIRTISEANVREHWAKRAKRSKQQRGLAQLLVEGALGQRVIYGGTVTLVRLGPRRLDPDNLAGSAKHVQDGVADALGIDDGDARIRWEYQQEKSKDYGVRVVITPAKGDSHA